jgi:hypothetical protein
MESGSSDDTSGVEPIVVELDPIVADLGTARQLWIPTESGLEHRVITVKIPPGVKDGTLLRLPGKGEPSPTGGPPGDLFVHVRVMPFVPGLAPDSWAAAAPADPAGPAAATPARRRRPSRRTVILLVVLAAVGTVVVATPIIRGSGSDPAPVTAGPALASAAGSPTAAPSSTQAPAGISPVSYQKALTAFDTQLARQFRALRRAQKPATVRTTMSDMQAALSNAKADLELLDPPVAVQSAHAALLDSVDVLTTDLAGAESAAADGQVCAGPSATALISRTAGAQQVRAAAANVATADRAHKYRVAGFLPTRRADRNRRLGNRTEIRHSTDGPGRLKIDNGAGDDTVVSLVRRGTHTPVLAVYVRGGAKTTVGRIGDGTYQIFMTSGQDWDPALRVFTRDCAFERFDDPFRYITTPTKYPGWEITLRKAVGGNAKTSNVPPESFPIN